MMLSIVESKRNIPNLILDTFRYTQTQILITTVYWKCENPTGILPPRKKLFVNRNVRLHKLNERFKQQTSTLNKFLEKFLGLIGIKKKSGKYSINRQTIVVIVILILILIGIIIAIPIVYTTGRNPGESDDQNTKNISKNYTGNDCVQESKTKAIFYISNAEPFPYKFHSYFYRPSVISKTVSLIFGFRHDFKSWSLDKISFVDTTDNKNLIKDGDFESNYLNKYYSQCILSNTRSSTSDILFDIPYSGDFYYNDETKVGMTYLFQQIDVIGGRYYNISFYLENRGFYDNTNENYFVLLVATVN
ncbi:unnamed protein product [Rotaria sp. Silwood2]|nr:unnamed protein product [Rotaria sp. Silwood2]CAF3370189.1 unnamed protein product [Rotaria sp. Silwood2]CAF4520081.1 unnamed protein product [Rotaria sp. Silwood2]CAF4522296.1 unnamed protein product [Rotaria sp. Silwood2]